MQLAVSIRSLFSQARSLMSRFFLSMALLLTCLEARRETRIPRTRAAGHEGLKVSFVQLSFAELDRLFFLFISLGQGGECGFCFQTSILPFLLRGKRIPQARISKRPLWFKNSAYWRA